MARHDSWGSGPGYYARNPDRCQVCTIAAPYWKNYPERAKWRFGKDGSIYCPDDLPPWVVSWRATQRK